MTIARRCALGVVLATSLGCASGDPDPPASDEPAGELVVFAAASLTDAVEQMAADFEARYPDISVSINTAGSSSLREQLLEGAPADVYLSADMANMEMLANDDAIESTPIVIATNELRIGVPSGNPGGIEGVESFGDSGLLLGMCASQVPCGDLAARMFRAAGVEPVVDTEEPNVSALALKISERELDGGIVYATDVLSRPEVEAVDIPTAVNQTNSYPLAVLTAAPNPVAARRFAEYASGPDGRRVLESLGFGPP